MIRLDFSIQLGQVENKKVKRGKETEERKEEEEQVKEQSKRR